MRPIKPVIDDAKLKAILEAERTASLGASQSSDLSDQRIRALDYYMGDMDRDMPAPDGQSSAVSTDVQDTVEGLLPIVLDVLVGSDNVAEFRPEGPEDEAAAAQETAFINNVFYEQNDGFLTMYTAVKDACLSKNSFIKWWMEKDEARTREDYRALTPDAYAMVASDTEVTIVDSEQYQDVDPLTQQPTTYYNVTVESVRTRLRPRIAAVAPEEMLVSKLARTIQTSPYLAHVQGRPQADVIADFPEKEEVIRNAPTRSLTTDNSEGFERQTVEDTADILGAAETINKDMREVEVTEHYIRLALEADKIARRYKITTVGKYDVLDIEEVTSWPFSTGTPILMPHRLFGRSVADLVIDIQQIKTSLLRATLNNAYFANNQRIEVSETHASENTIDDLLNNRVGGIVRTRMPGGLNQIETQSIGHWVAPIIEYMDGVAAKRTGVSDKNTGLDQDSLNHSRPGAVNRIMDAAEMRVKLIARIFAETLVVDTFRGLHEMLQQYGEEQEVAYLSGKWITVNPREWKTRKTMKVTLPLGGVSKQQMLGFFGNMLNIQKEIIQEQGGTDGPMVSWQGVYSTVDQMAKLAGLKGAQPFFMQPGPPDPNRPKPPDPKMVEANARAAATQADQQGKQQLAREQFAHDTQMEALKLNAQRQREQEEFAHKQAMDRLQFAHDREMAVIEARFDQQLEAFRANEQIKIDRAQAQQQARKGVGEV
jgi:hypothetical protein